MTYYPDPGEYRDFLPQLGFTIEREREDRRADWWTFHVTFAGRPYRVYWSREQRFSVMQWDGEEGEPVFNTSVPATGQEGSDEFKRVLRSLVADPEAFAIVHAPEPYVPPPEAAAVPPTMAAKPAKPAKLNILPGVIGLLILVMLWLVFRNA